MQKQPPEVVYRKSYSEKFRKIHRNSQVFSCEFCEIFKNNFFTEHICTTVSGYVQLKN